MKSEQVLEHGQLKALTHPVRLQIVRSLADRPQTTTQVAEILDQCPLNLYYHMRVLEEAGLIEVVETRTKGNLIERYYQSVARVFTAAIPLTHETQGSDTLPEAVQAVLGAVEADARRSDFDSGLPVIASNQHIRASRHKIKELTRRIQETIEQVGLSDQEQGELCSFTVLFIPLGHKDTTEDTGKAAAGCEQR